ncbi:MAG: sensor histidine kinase, partial [Chitinophagaceae bacterium]|nr:sensor histidine kinase [Chitinophagaceae bacterium]
YYHPFLSEKARQSSKQMLVDPPFPRQMFTLTITYLLTLTGLGYFIRKLEDEIKLRKLKEQHLQLQIDYLKAQLHPHFFFNTLNNIYSLALDASADTAPTVAKLADLMRYIIYDGNKKTVPLTKEVEFIQNYMDLERIRHNSHTAIHFSLQGKVEGIQIEPLLFIPLIENGFKHGINGSVTRAWLNAVLRIEKDEIQLQVKNSKDKNHQVKYGGIGLENTRQRLQLLYPGQHSLLVQEKDDSFSACLKVKLK